MADRIIANRPYQEVEELLNVSGVGPALLKRLDPMVSVTEAITQEDEDVIYLGEETAIEDQSADVESEPTDKTPLEVTLPSWEGSGVEETEALGAKDRTGDEEGITQAREKPEGSISKEKAIIPVKDPTPIKELNGKKPKPITLGNALLMTAAFSFVTFILAVLLSLGILGSLNNGLRYVSLDQIQAIIGQVETLNSELGLLNEDISGLRSRLDNLESLSGRVSELELKTEQFSNDLTALAEEYQGVIDQVADFMDTAERFQIFLNGLGDLLDTLTEGQ